MPSNHKKVLQRSWPSTTEAEEGTWSGQSFWSESAVSSATDQHEALTLQPREGLYFFLQALCLASLKKYISESFIRPHKVIISGGRKSLLLVKT